jgi:hypothetical protein
MITELENGERSGRDLICSILRIWSKGLRFEPQNLLNTKQQFCTAMLGIQYSLLDSLVSPNLIYSSDINEWGM